MAKQKIILESNLKHYDDKIKEYVGNKAGRDEIIGENLLPYPYYDGSSKTVNGITTTIDENGWAHIKGTASAAANCFDFTARDVEFPAGTYTMSGVPEGASSSGYRAWLGIYKSGTTTQLQSYQVYADGVTFTANEPFTMIFRATASAGAVVDIVFKPMLETGTVAHEYQPYDLSRHKLREDIDNIDIGVADVSVTQSLTSGTQVGTITVDEETTILYAPTNTDTKVTQTVKSDNANYPLLLAPSGQTATKTTTACFDSGVTLNPSTNTINANISGKAASATNATQLGGKKILDKNATDTWEGIPYIDDKGVMEVGKYIDFHTTDGNANDKDVRITANTDGLTIDGNTNLNIKTPLKIVDDAGVSKNIIETINPTPDSPTEHGSEVLIGGDGNVFIGAGESHRNLRNALANEETKLAGETYGAAGENMFVASDSNVLIYSAVNTPTNRKAIAFDTNGNLHPLISGQANDLGSITYPWRNAYFSNAITLNDGTSQGYFGTFVKGTTSTKGDNRLVLGNSIASGNDKNAVGKIFLYGENTGYTSIVPTNNTTSNITVNLPNAGGTLALNKVATKSANGLMSAADKAKLDDISTGGEVNQNAFSNVKVGNTTIAADSKTDTLTLAGSNVTLTPDATNDKVTIGITKNNILTALGFTPSEFCLHIVKTANTDLNSYLTQGIYYFSSGYTPTNIPYGVNGFLIVIPNDGNIIKQIWLRHGTAGSNDHHTSVRLSTDKGVTWGAWSRFMTDRDKATTSADGIMAKEDKSKLDGIATGANKYTHPTYTAKSSGLYKVTVDGTGHVSAVTAVAKSDITGLGIPAQDTTYSAMTAATSSAAGKAGLVPAPAAGAQGKFLRGDGTWQTPSTGTDTKNTAGSTDSSSKLFLIGATSQAANPQTYSHNTAYVGTDGCLYSNSKKVSVDGHTHNYAGSSSAGGSATKVYGTLTNPSSETTYALPFHADVSSGNKSLLNNDGIQYVTKEGTASADGYGILRLGNGTESGTAKNKYGILRLFGTNNKYINVKAGSITDNRTITFPNASGTVALDIKKARISFTKSKSLKLDTKSNYLFVYHNDTSMYKFFLVLYNGSEFKIISLHDNGGTISYHLSGTTLTFSNSDTGPTNYINYINF